MRTVLAYSLTYLLTPVLAVGITLGTMWLLSPWLRRRVLSPGPHQLLEDPSPKPRIMWWYAVHDELSHFGDSIVFTRSLLGSFATVAVAAFICDLLSVPRQWPLAASLVLVFLVWDLSMFRFVSSLRISSTARALTFRQGWARLLGDVLGVALGLTMWFSGAA